MNLKNIYTQLFAMSILTLFCAEVVCAARLRTKTSLDVSFESYVYSDDEDSDSVDASYAMRTNFNLKAKKSKWRGQFQAIGIADEKNSSRSTLVLQDFWIGYKSKKWQVQAGYLTESWTSMDVFQPIEALNTINYDSNIVFPDKKGEQLIKFEYFWNTGSVDIYYGPSHEEPKYPGTASRLSVAAFSFTDPIWIDENGEARDGSSTGDRIGLRFRQKVKKADLQFTYLRQQNREYPLLSLSGLNLVAIFLPTQEIGFTYTQVLNSWILKLEAVERQFLNDPISLFTVNSQTTQPDHLEYAIGVETALNRPNGHTYTFYFELQNLDLKKTGSYSSLTSDEIREYAQFMSVFQNDLMLGVRWAANDHVSREVRTTLVADLERSQEIYLAASYSQMLSRKWKAEAGWSLVNALEMGTPAVGLQNQHNDKRIHFMLTRFF